MQHYPNAPLYDPATLRTFFIEFENADWEAELVAFNNTDVDVPATVTVDGRVYRDVGVHFRGNSSFGVGNGYKRSLNLTFDFVHDDQAIGGYRTLNFLNANTDPTLMRTVLSMHIARQYIAAPKANFVRVVINGENWGVYANAQQFNKEFVADNFGTTKGARWKIPQGGGAGRRFHVSGRRREPLQPDVPDQVEGRARGLGGADRSGEDARRDAGGIARSGPGVTSRRRRLPSLSRPRQRHDQRATPSFSAPRTTRSIAIPTGGSTSSSTMPTRCSAPGGTRS